jgi:signal transduction histidine kinase
MKPLFSKLSDVDLKCGKGSGTGTGMNAENLRHFKHELRTPINHIIGYGELLAESAEDAGDSAIDELAKGIHASGQILSRLLESNLAAGEMDEKQMEALCSSVRPIIEKILATLRVEPALRVARIYTQDIERIQQAASQFMSLVCRRSTS